MLAIALILVAASFGGRAARADDSCIFHAAEAERELGIPNGLLQSLAKVESGQEDNPFALSIGGREIHARDSKAAAKYLRDRRGNFRSNTYVGCMQLSLSVHRSEFGAVERMIDPRQNVWYAARMLNRLHTEEGNWRVALVRYNGGTTRTSQNYVCKVWKNLNNLDQQSANLIEMSACSGVAQNVAPKTRQTSHDRQVAAIN